MCGRLCQFNKFVLKQMLIFLITKQSSWYIYKDLVFSVPSSSKFGGFFLMHIKFEPSKSPKGSKEIGLHHLIYLNLCNSFINLSQFQNKESVNTNTTWNQKFPWNVKTWQAQRDGISCSNLFFSTIKLYSPNQDNSEVIKFYFAY